MRGMRWSLPAVAVVATLLLAACGRAGPSAAPGDAERARVLADARALLAHGAAAWNRGDLESFISDYDSGATFVTTRGVLRGAATIREHYASRFAPGGVRDSLSFRDVEADVLAPDAANVIAFWVLMRGDSVTAEGPTSLVLRRSAGRWRILHDHSS